MATIELSDLFYAPITEGADGLEIYGKPIRLAKAIQANLSIEVAEAMLFADDNVQETIREFQPGTLSLDIDELTPEVVAVLLGTGIDSNGVVISSSEDVGPPVAIGFRARRAGDTYRYFWLYRVLFATPSTSLQTKGDSVTFQTPTIEGTILRRNKPDSRGRHPWKADAVEGHANVPNSVIADWFESVYDPVFGTTGGISGVSGASSNIGTATHIKSDSKPETKPETKSDTKTDKPDTKGN